MNNINEENKERKTLFIEEKYKRICADFDNYKKRINKEIENKIKLSNEKLINELIEIIDNLEQAIKFKKEENTIETEVIKGIIKTAEKFNNILKNFGLKSFSTIGKKFDHNINEAILQLVDDDLEENTIKEEYQKGYILNGKLIRPSRVIVSKKKDIK